MESLNAHCPDPSRSGLTRAWRMDRTCAATRWCAGLNYPSQCLWHWRPARDNQASGPGFRARTSPSLRSKTYAPRAKTCAQRNTAHLYPGCARRTSLRASDSLENAQHQLSPPKSRIPIPWYTSYNTISPSYTPLPGAMTALALQTSWILVVGFHAVCRCTSRRTARRASLGSVWTFSQNL